MITRQQKAVITASIDLYFATCMLCFREQQQPVGTKEAADAFNTAIDALDTMHKKLAAVDVPVPTYAEFYGKVTTPVPDPDGQKIYVQTKPEK